MVRSVTIRSPDAAAGEPSVFVAAWLLAELPPGATTAISTGPDWVRFELGSAATEVVLHRLRVALCQRRFDGWHVNDQESDPPSPSGSDAGPLVPGEP